MVLQFDGNLQPHSLSSNLITGFTCTSQLVIMTILKYVTTDSQNGKRFELVIARNHWMILKVHTTFFFGLNASLQLFR